MPRVLCTWQSMHLSLRGAKRRGSLCIRHCEARSDAAVYEYMDCFAALAMTALCHDLQPRDTRHCEERSDAAVHDCNL